jgi:hypothetical protein
MPPELREIENERNGMRNAKAVKYKSINGSQNTSIETSRAQDLV